MAADMSTRYQVFVSSTFADLLDERQAVISALLEMDAFPAGMELFPASDDDAWTLIKGVIDDCDYYLLVIGGRYGSRDPSDSLSYTEKEYDYAVSQGKPVMAFLHGDPDSIPMGKGDSDQDAREALKKFRTKVQAAKHVKYWSSGEDLAGKVARSFMKFTKSYPAIGWVRADQQTSKESLEQINQLQRRISELESQLERTRTAPPPGTEGLSQGDDGVDFVIVTKSVVTDPGSSRYQFSLEVEIDPTWDELLSVVGHHLLQECEESQLKNYLDRWLVSVAWSQFGLDDDIINSLVKMLRERQGDDKGEEGEEGVDLSSDEFYVTDREARFSQDQFGVILIQLKALGLIQESTRKRSVTDTRKYWMLTPYGENRTIQLKAIRKTGLDVVEV